MDLHLYRTSFIWDLFDVHITFLTMHLPPVKSAIHQILQLATPPMTKKKSFAVNHLEKSSVREGNLSKAISLLYHLTFSQGATKAEPIPLPPTEIVLALRKHSFWFH